MFETTVGEVLYNSKEHVVVDIPKIRYLFGQEAEV